MASPTAQRSPGWRDRIATYVYASPLYGFTLRAEPPKRLKRLPPAPWPGDAERGKAILAGRFHCAGQPVNPQRPGWYDAQLSEAATRRAARLLLPRRSRRGRRRGGAGVRPLADRRLAR